MKFFGWSGWLRGLRGPMYHYIYQLKNYPLYTECVLGHLEAFLKNLWKKYSGMVWGAPPVWSPTILLEFFFIEGFPKTIVRSGHTRPTRSLANITSRKYFGLSTGTNMSRSCLSEETGLLHLQWTRSTLHPTHILILLVTGEVHLTSQYWIRALQMMPLFLCTLQLCSKVACTEPLN